jgi:hypothetical protein
MNLWERNKFYDSTIKNLFRSIDFLSSCFSTHFSRTSSLDDTRTMCFVWSMPRWSHTVLALRQRATSECIKLLTYINDTRCNFNFNFKSVMCQGIFPLHYCTVHTWICVNWNSAQHHRQMYKHIDRGLGIVHRRRSPPLLSPALASHFIPTKTRCFTSMNAR